MSPQKQGLRGGRPRVQMESLRPPATLIIPHYASLTRSPTKCDLSIALATGGNISPGGYRCSFSLRALGALVSSMIRQMQPKSRWSHHVESPSALSAGVERRSPGEWGRGGRATPTYGGGTEDLRGRGREATAGGSEGEGRERGWGSCSTRHIKTNNSARSTASTTCW